MKENGKGSVGKGLLMVTQIGISMIVPIFLGAFLGYLLDGWLGTSFFFLVFLLFGILAAFRNIYKLTKPFYAEDLKREQQEQAYWNDLRRGREEAGGGAVQKEPVWRQGGQRLPAPPKDAGAMPESRSKAEEEFAAWRRERERKQDGGADGAGRTAHDCGTCSDKAGGNGCGDDGN